MALFKKPGSSLTGVIVSNKWDVKEFEGGKGEPYYRRSMVLEIKPDGAEEVTPRFLDGGFHYPDEQTISEDGFTIEGGDDNPVREDTEVAAFIGSLIEKGFPESNFDPSGRNFQPMNGWRVEIGQVIDEPRQLAAGKKKLGVKAKMATREELMEAGKRKDRNDPTKSYNQTQLRVVAVLGQPEVAAKGAAKRTAASKPATKPAAKGNGKVDHTDDTDRTDAALVDLLTWATEQARDGKRKSAEVAKSELSSLIVRYALSKNKAEKDSVTGEEREWMRKALSDEAYLADAKERGLITFDQSNKSQPIGLAA